MFQEPQILPWLARKAGVPLPEAREIWRGIASKGETDRGNDSGDLAWEQIRDLREQLRERGSHGQLGSAEGTSDLACILPLPLFQTWVQCQTRIVLNVWLTWARAAQSATRQSSCPPRGRKLSAT